MRKYVIRVLLWILKGNISLEERSLLINAILDRLSALPLRGIIQVSENGSLSVNGRELDFEERGLLKDSAKNLRDNRVFGLIQDQVLFQAMTFGVNSSTSFEQLYFSKAAVWWGQNENRLVRLLADENPDLPG